MIQTVWTNEPKVQFMPKFGQDPITITNKEELGKYDQGEVLEETVLILK